MQLRGQEPPAAWFAPSPADDDEEEEEEEANDDAFEERGARRSASFDDRDPDERYMDEADVWFKETMGHRLSPGVVEHNGDQRRGRQRYRDHVSTAGSETDQDVPNLSCSLTTGSNRSSWVEPPDHNDSSSIRDTGADKDPRRVADADADADIGRREDEPRGPVHGKSLHDGVAPKVLGANKPA